jgi:hypothetical protein
VAPLACLPISAPTRAIDRSSIRMFDIETGLLRGMPVEGTGARCHSGRECPMQLRELAGTARGPMRKILQTPGEPSFTAVVQPGSKWCCLVAGVSPRKGDEGYEETSRKTARALDSYAVCRTGAGRVAHKVRHGLAEATVHLLRRLQQDLRPSDAHNDFCEEAHRPHSSLLRI